MHITRSAYQPCSLRVQINFARTMKQTSVRVSQHVKHFWVYLGQIPRRFIFPVDVAKLHVGPRCIKLSQNRLKSAGSGRSQLRYVVSTINTMEIEARR